MYLFVYDESVLNVECSIVYLYFTLYYISIEMLIFFHNFVPHDCSYNHNLVKMKAKRKSTKTNTLLS